MRITLTDQEPSEPQGDDDDGSYEFTGTLEQIVGYLSRERAATHHLRHELMDEAIAAVNARDLPGANERLVAFGIHLEAVRLCGVGHPLINGGEPCVKYPDHVAADRPNLGYAVHITDSGLWWHDDRTLEDILAEQPKETV